MSMPASLTNDASDAVATKEERQPARRLFDLINVPSLLFVAICFFLPLTKMSCGPIEISFSGLNMALGTAPHVNAPTPQDRQQARREIVKEDFRKSPLLLLVPAAAVIGALLSFVALRGEVDRVRPVALAAGPALVTLLLAYYTGSPASAWNGSSSRTWPASGSRTRSRQPSRWERPAGFTPP